MSFVLIGIFSGAFGQISQKRERVQILFKIGDKDL